MRPDEKITTNNILQIARVSVSNCLHNVVVVYPRTP
jgi:hypothetical protein